MVNQSTFADALRAQATHTFTENGENALNTTGNKCLDFYGTIGALRSADEARITRLFADAYKEDALLATKTVFYGRDVRGGLGEREVFRKLLRYMAQVHPEAVIRNIPLIGEYGRFDDLYSLVGTPLEKEMWFFIKLQLQDDEENMRAGKPVSLLAKWLKTADASSKNTRQAGINTALNLGLSVPVYKRKVKALRRYIGIVESKMSAGQWEDIDYSKVPSRAALLYRKAFGRHDEARYSAFINKAFNGEAKINSGTLYPYDLVKNYLGILSNDYYNRRRNTSMDLTIESQWKQLPNYVEGENNVLVVADTSGSMYSSNGRPIATAVSLAIYFAERNKGAYKDIWMNFSDRPSAQVLKGETLYQKVMNMDYDNWGCSTNLKAVFDFILSTAKNQKHAGLEVDVPKAVVIISDMEINRCLATEDYNGWGYRSSYSASNWMTFYDKMRKRFSDLGIEIPNIIFWNVESRHDIFHVDRDRVGVQLASGSAASTFKSVMDAIGMTPVEAMVKTLSNERYDAISIAKNYKKVDLK